MRDALDSGLGGRLVDTLRDSSAARSHGRAGVQGTSCVSDIARARARTIYAREGYPSRSGGPVMKETRKKAPSSIPKYFCLK